MNIIGKDLVPNEIVEIVRGECADDLGTLLVNEHGDMRHFPEVIRKDLVVPATLYRRDSELVEGRFIILHLPQIYRHATHDPAMSKYQSVWNELLYSTLHECRHSTQWTKMGRYPPPIFLMNSMTTEWEEDARKWAVGKMAQYTIPPHLRWLEDRMTN